MKNSLPKQPTILGNINITNYKLQTTKAKKVTSMENSNQWLQIHSILLLFFLLVSSAQSRPIVEILTNQKSVTEASSSTLSPRHIAEKSNLTYLKVIAVEAPSVVLSENSRHKEGIVPEAFYAESKRQSPGGPDPQHH